MTTSIGGAVRPVSRTVPGDIRATFVRILAYMGALGMLAIAAASFFQETPVVAAVKPAPRPEWTNVERPHPAFELIMPELSGGVFDYAILRRNSDGTRKDVLTFGDIAGRVSYAMVEVYRPGAAGEHFIDAPSEIAARIVGFSVIDDVKPAGSIDSKFGAFDLVDFAVAARNRPDARPHRCLGFAHAFTEPVMQLAGWYCSGGDEMVDRATLGCLLDRLTLLSAGGDETLAGLFARAEIKRTFCGRRSPILAATPERAIVIANAPRGARSAARLRGRLAAH